MALSMSALTASASAPSGSSTSSSLAVWQAGTHEEIPGAQAPGSVLALVLGGVLLALGIVLAPPPMPERRPGERGGGLLPLR